MTGSTRRAGAVTMAVLIAVVALAGCGGHGYTASTTQARSTIAPFQLPEETPPAAPLVPAAPPAPPAAVATPVPPVPPVAAATTPQAALAPRTTAPTAQDLTGRTIVLDAGHAGGNAAQPARLAALVPAGGYSKACNTAGTETDAGYPEHAFTFDVVARAATLLRSRGATVVLTRTTDTVFGPCVDERAKIANSVHADAAIYVHADGGPVSGRGFHVIAPALAPDRGNGGVLDSGYQLALALRDAFRSATDEPYSTYTATDALVRRSDLAGLTLARVPAVFIECANMRNAEDAALVTSSAWRARAAQGIVTAAAAFVEHG